MSGKGKERHLFLFKDKLMVTKKKKPKKAGEPVTYEFKLLIDVRIFKNIISRCKSDSLEYDCVLANVIKI